MVETGGGGYRLETLTEVENRLMACMGWISITGCSELPGEIDPELAIAEEWVEAEDEEVGAVGENKEEEIIIEQVPEGDDDTIYYVQDILEETDQNNEYFEVQNVGNVVNEGKENVEPSSKINKRKGKLL